MTMTLILGLLALTPAQAADPVAAVEALQPQTTRAGTLRFVDPVLGEAAAPALLAARLMQADDAPAVRHAVANALVRSLAATGVTLPGLTALVQAEPDAAVRAELVPALDAAVHGQVLRTLLSEDADPRVRAAVASAISDARDAVTVAALETATADADAEVRLVSVRGLGWIGAGFDAAAALLTDADVGVRRAAVQALSRIDPERASTAVAPLADDSDAHVRHLVARIRG